MYVCADTDTIKITLRIFPSRKNTNVIFGVEVWFAVWETALTMQIVRRCFVVSGVWPYHALHHITLTPEHLPLRSEWSNRKTMADRIDINFACWQMLTAMCEFLFVDTTPYLSTSAHYCFCMQTYTPSPYFK